MATMRVGSTNSRRRFFAIGGAARSISSPTTVSSMALSMYGLGQGALAPLAQAGRRRLGRDRRHIPPAAFAFHAAGALDGDARMVRPSISVAAFPHLHLGHDEQHRQVLLVACERREVV